MTVTPAPSTVEMPTKAALRSKRLTRDDRAERTRQQLLDVARQLFTDKGYFATALEEIVLEADLTQGVLYHHFGKQTGTVQGGLRGRRVGLEGATCRRSRDRRRGPREHYLRENATSGDCWEVYTYGMTTTVMRLPEEELVGHLHRISRRPGGARLGRVAGNPSTLGRRVQRGRHRPGDGRGGHRPARPRRPRLDAPAVQEECAVMVAHDHRHDVDRAATRCAASSTFRVTTATTARRRRARP